MSTVHPTLGLTVDQMRRRYARVLSRVAAMNAHGIGYSPESANELEALALLRDVDVVEVREVPSPDGYAPSRLYWIKPE